MSMQVNPNMILRKIGSSRVLVPIGKSVDEIASVYNLNDTAGTILECLKKGMNPEQIAEHLKSEYDIPQATSPIDEINKVCKDFQKNGILI